MQSKDIKPGRFYCVRLDRFGGQTNYDQYVRIERYAGPRYADDIYVWEGTRFQVRGTFRIPIAARDIIKETHPDDKALRIIALMEAEGDVNAHDQHDR